MTEREAAARIGFGLWRLREERGLLQKTVAKLSGIKDKSLSHYERGRRPVSAVQLLRLLEVYGATLGELEAAMTPMQKERE